MNANQLLTEAQGAEFAQVRPKTIGDWGRSGKLPRVVLSSRCIRYRLGDIQALIDSSLQQGAHGPIGNTETTTQK